MKDVRSIIKELRKANARISINGDSLVVDHSNGTVGEELMTEFRTNEKAIMEYLIENTARNSFSRIKPVPQQAGYPLSPSQFRLWVLCQLQDASAAYNVSRICVIEGELDCVALERSFRLLIDRHEVLRTEFRKSIDGQVMQFVLQPGSIELPLRQTDIRGKEDKEQELERLIEGQLATPFNLDTAPLLRAALFRTGDHEWIFSFTIHHIVSDGWSIGVLIDELLLFYHSITAKNEHGLPPLRIQYKDFSAWQREQLDGPSIEEHKAYWMDQFAGDIPVLEFPEDKPRPAFKTYNGAKINRLIDPKLGESIKAFCHSRDSTLFMGLLSVVNILLYRYTGQRDIVIGTPMAGRDHIDLEGQVGFYVNTLALRSRFEGSDSFADVLDNARKLTLAAYAHQAYPFDELVELLTTQRDLSRNPLFDVQVIVQNQAGDERTNTGLMIKDYQGSGKLTSVFDIVFNFTETKAGLHLCITYNSDIYASASMDRLARHLEQLLAAALTDPHMPVDSLVFLNEQETEKLLTAFNVFSRDIPTDQTLISLFEEQAKKTPDHIAVMFGNSVLTYREINEKSDRLAGLLRQQYDICPNEVVGMVLDRSDLMILAILAIQKAGAAYMPLDPEYPKARKEFVIKDSGIKLLITRLEYAFELDYFEGSIFTIDAASAEGPVQDDHPKPVILPEHLAYVIYTSGSTGEPKGVMIEHKAIVNTIIAQIQTLGIGELDRGLQFSSPSFDASVWEIFLMLLSGGTLCIIDEDAKKDPQALAGYISDNGITLATLPPAILGVLEVEEIRTLKKLITAGEAAILEKAIAFSALGEYYNAYGPTETSICATVYKADRTSLLSRRSVPIGRPILNSPVYILDHNARLVPEGVTGELCVGGAGLARGYLNREELTKQKFVDNPYVPGRKMYKTGDLARWLPDGNIEFIGRNDEQVKIRGFRIEIGEIEQAIQRYQGIQSAAVTAAANQSGNRELVAYLVSREQVDVRALRSFLAEALPAYMLPAYYVQLSSLPLNTSGKVDRKKLSAAGGDLQQPEREYMPPGDVIEEKLALMWQEVLGKERVGIKDDFFEMGGHSLKVVRLISQIYREFDVEIAMKELFELTVLEDQANLIRQTKNKSFTVVPKAAPSDGYPLTSSQRRLWVLSRFKNGNIAYNLPGIYLFEGDLDTTALELAFHSIIERHEILRTVFRENEQGDIVQVVIPADGIGIKLSFADLDREEDQYRELKQRLEEVFSTPFNLAAGPMLRMNLYRLGAKKWLFAYAMHHIISDAWSMDILLRELMTLYNGHVRKESIVLPPLRIQYKDYAVWQQQQLADPSMSGPKVYWQQQFEGEIPVLELPTDKPRPAVKTYNGGRISCKLDPGAGRRLSFFCKEQGATLFMGLLSAVKTLLYRYSGQNDIIVGTSIASREHADLEDQIGFYVNTLALRTRFDGDGGFKDLLERVRQVTLQAYAHQAYPFDELVQDLQLHRDMSRNALFDVIVVLQNADYGKSAVGTLENVKVTSDISLERPISKFDLSFVFSEQEQEINMQISYNSDLFEKDTVERMADHFSRVLDAVMKDPLMAIGRLNYMSQEEQEQLLDFGRAGEVAFAAPDASVVSLFEAQVGKTPLAIGLAFDQQHFTYSELDKLSGILAVHLRKDYGVGANDLVGIMLNRSANMIIAILGVLRSGAAYVAIDAENPRARKAAILSDAAAKVLITDSTSFFDLDYFHGSIFAIDVQLDPAAGIPELPPVTIHPEDLAYVVYTSGSTGLPKGVKISHASLVDYFFGILQKTNIRDCRTFGLVSTIAADLGNTVIYPSLLTGGTLRVYSDAEVRDPRKMADTTVDCLKIVPSHWKALQEERRMFAPAKCLIFGGEQLTPDIPDIIRQNHGTFHVYNHYGPSETTIGKLIRRVDLENTAEKISLGKPFCRSFVYILDARGNLVPTGATGEIHIGGDGLSKGYLNNPELTAERFISDPFRKGERVYRTGDLGRWLSDGNVEFRGRNDDQLKIRGYRVEVGEIEAGLRSYPGITAAIVLGLPDKTGSKTIVAYVETSRSLSLDDLLRHLGKTLPTYMTPNHFVFLEAFPLTSNGKIDRKRLPRPAEESDLQSAAYIPPQTRTEKELVRIWEEVLVRNKIGVQDDFFRLGGHSLKATRLASLIHKRFNVKVDFNDLFTYTILKDQADLIDQAIKVDFKEIAPAEELPDYPLSSSQRRLWILSQYEQGNIAYNSPAIYWLDGTLDIPSLKDAVQKMVRRHEILRTVFRPASNGEIRQLILSPQQAAISILVDDLSGEVDKEEKIKRLIREEIFRPFDLAGEPLLRIGLYQAEVNKWAFIFNFHHIISDGWSKNVFLNELLTIYGALVAGREEPLIPLRIQYKDYAVWQQTLLAGGSLEEHKRYWLHQFEGELPVLELPGDRLRPAIKTYSGRAIAKRFSATVVNRMRAIAKQQNCTLFMGLLGAVNTLLFRYTGQNDIIVGTPMAGRDHPDLEDQIGFYVNTLALRTRFEPEITFPELLENIRNVALGAYEHQAYPFDRLIDDLNVKRDMSRNPLFDVMIVLQNQNEVFRNETVPDGLKVYPYREEDGTGSKFDLLFNFAEAGEELHAGLVYNSDIFDQQTAERMLHHLEQILDAVPDQVHKPICRLDYLHEAEKQLLLRDFNLTEADYPAGRTVIDLFEEQVSRTPDGTALVFEDRQLSYRELNERSNRLARYMLNNAAPLRGECVAVLLERSEWSVIGMISILKLGCTYVPIDRSLPDARIRFILEDSRVKTVLVDSQSAGLAGYRLIKVDTVPEEQDASNLALTIAEEDASYVIYTSGSTGNPKGVEQTYKMLYNLISWDIYDAGFNKKTKHLQFSSFSFDSSIHDLFYVLSTGGEAHVINESSRTNLWELKDYIIEQGITVLSMPYAALKALFTEIPVQELNGHVIREIISTGEQLYITGGLREFLKANPSVRIFNLYGPSETHVVTAISYRCSDDVLPEKASIGRPVSNSNIYILDTWMQPVPIGVEGEIFIGGDNLARGYKNRPDLTGEKFIADPFEEGRIIYRSGDVGRWFPDGNIEYVGRKDNQVKINGYRIELGEIELALRNHEQIEEVAVIAKDAGTGNKTILAYLVSRQRLNEREVRGYLKGLLPSYMIPSHLAQIDRLPLTVNGKVDTRALPLPEQVRLASASERVLPGNEVESRLADIWGRILGISAEKISMKDDFFTLGGSSMEATRLIGQVQQEFGVKLQLKDIFFEQTLESIASVVSTMLSAGEITDPVNKEVARFTY